jgi:hypothetical protein
MTALLWIVAVVLVLAGIAGTLIPALPGTPLVFGGLLLAAWMDGFQKVGVGTIGFLAALTALAFGVDLLAAGLGARRAGASRRAVVGAAAGTIVGLFFGFAGIVLGPFIGAVAGEWLARRDIGQAGRAGAAAWAGFILGVGLKLALAFVMVGVFAAAYLL